MWKGEGEKKIVGLGIMHGKAYFCLIVHQLRYIMSQVTKPQTPPSGNSPRFRLFYWLSLALLLLNLLVVNDYAPLWDPWEGLNWWVSRESPSQLPHFFYATWQSLFPDQFFAWRLPGTLLLLASLGIWYYGARPIFGERGSRYALLVLATAWPLVFSAKIAVNDIWLFAAQLLMVLALLRFLKQAQSAWRWISYGAILFALSIHLWSTVVLLVVLSTYLWGLHPQGKRLTRLLPWLSLPLLLLAPADPEGFLFTYGQLGYPYYLLYLSIGLLPWSGFFFGSLADLVYKLRRKEEMALILAGLLLATLLAQSPLLILVFALLIARQISAYFVPNYPYRAVVKGFAVLHLIFSFCLITYLLLSAFAQVGAVGFRGVMAVGAIYWMLTFIAVIGLYSYRPEMILGGMVWGALLSFLLFWLQLYPLLESRSIQSGDLLEKMEKQSTAERPILLSDSLWETYPSWRFMARQRQLRLSPVGVSDPTVSTTTAPDLLLTDRPQAPRPNFRVVDSLAAYSWTQLDSLSFYLWRPASGPE